MLVILRGPPPENVAACLPSLVADFDTVDVLETAGDDVVDRWLIHYRLGLSRVGARWVCTQTAVCAVVEKQIAVIDLLCSGFREERTTAGPHHRDRPDGGRPSREAVSSPLASFARDCDVTALGPQPTHTDQSLASSEWDIDET